MILGSNLLTCLKTDRVLFLMIIENSPGYHILKKEKKKKNWTGCFKLLRETELEVLSKSQNHPTLV